jgi:hypothetical protein
MNPRAMVLGCPRGDRSSRQLITILTRTTAEARPDTAPVSTRGKERKMLSAAYGVLAMVPVVFGVAGYVLVSR